MSRFSNTDLNDLSDEEILIRSQSDPELFELLVERYEAAFLRKVHTILFSKEDAEEVVQDAFTRIYVYAGSYRSQEGARFSSWAYMILTRLAFTRYQKLKKKNAKILALDPEVYEHLPDTENILETLSVSNEVLVALSNYLKPLPDFYGYSTWKEKTQEEIARSEGASVFCRENPRSPRQKII